VCRRCGSSIGDSRSWCGYYDCSGRRFNHGGGSDSCRNNYRDRRRCDCHGYLHGWRWCRYDNRRRLGNGRSRCRYSDGRCDSGCRGSYCRSFNRRG
jgi:hypothetical protein